LLSKIKVANQSKKKSLIIKFFSLDIFLLEVLWKNSFIKGYSKIFFGYIIFLSYNTVNFSRPISKVLTKKKLKILLKLNQNDSYLVLTFKKISIYSKVNLVHFGGKIVAKL
jgi:ribosomal protein S8